MMTELPKKISNYLNRYSSEKYTVSELSKKLYEVVVVIPTLDEFENLKRLLSSFEKNNSDALSKTLLLFVVNNLKSASSEVKEENLRSLKFFRSIDSNKINIGVVDCSTGENGFDEKDGGVGLARKIGMDLALSLFDYNSAKKNILVCLDADCTVTENYLSEIIFSFNEKNLDAAVAEYEHPLNDFDKNLPAIICYEIFLRYYLLGLKFANSPFAFHTIGSTIVCTAESYVKTEGMNKRKAAEDFYFLEKLSKNFLIEKINSAKVYPSSRGSWRVPFGTGQRVNRFNLKTEDEYLLYNPESFELLRRWNNFYFNSDFSSNDFSEIKNNFPNEYINFLEEQNFFNVILSLKKNSKSSQQFFQQKIKWFDAFKTLKLVHYLRDNGFPNLNMFDAVDDLLKKIGYELEEFQREKREIIPSIEIQKKYLQILRIVSI